jgi:NAD(P)-dependent dehydrogenase (short-subunit alcohol dehydrogenase family)
MTGELDVNELRFEGRVALITGSGRGLGREYALALAARGASIVVNDPGVGLLGEGGDIGPAQAVVEEITAAGGKAVATFDAVGTVAAADAIVATAIDAFGRLDIVINNGGNFLPRHRFEETTPEGFESLWRVHVLGATHVLRAAWPHMKRQSYGRIVNTASHSGYLGAAGSIEYAAAKAAIHGLTRALSLESAEHGIAVNAIAPGAMTRPVQQIKNIPDSFKTGAFAPELVAPTVVWLCHEECSVNGESFGVIAGTTTRIRVSETRGYASRSPTPEQIRDHFGEICDQAAFDASGLIFCNDSLSRGAELVAAYARL